MLAVRGVLEAPAYDDEPTRGSAGLRGGGDRKRGAAMRPPPPVESKRRRSSTAGADGQEHTEPPADEAARGDLPEPPPVVGRTMTREMAGSSAYGWFCGLLRRHIGIAVARPVWYMAGDALAARAGVQIAAACGLHSVNHALHTLNGFVPHTWQAFDGRARADERKPDGDWEHSALLRSVEAAGARMCPMHSRHLADLRRPSARRYCLTLCAHGRTHYPLKNFECNEIVDLKKHGLNMSLSQRSRRRSCLV